MAKNYSCSSLSLCERIARKNTLQRAVDLVILFLLISLLRHRLLSINDHGVPWIVAFMCELWFTFNWILTMNCKWNPVEYKTYPDCLFQRVIKVPPVDIFVTTADPVLEPPIIIVNTVLSLLAMDYPAHKLACYVSDDGGSALTFFALVEASKFAKLWVPFCKRHRVLIRAPFRHFSTEEDNSKMCFGEHISPEFHQERTKLKDAYEKLVKKIEDASQEPRPCDFSSEEFEVFSNIERGNHASIIKVVWENRDGNPDGLPHLVYISREKRPKHPHHYKAGAMNVLTRVSGVMTNAPFMLNVDCDMYANNPQIVMHAMCLLLGLNEKESGFVQSPQFFYDGPKEAMMVLQRYMGQGIVGLQGPFYQGTGCFHRRKVIYGSWPEHIEIGENTPSSDDAKKFDLEELRKTFGNSVELKESVARILSGSKGLSVFPSNLSISVDAALGVSGCGYEQGTFWGKEIGWMYGSTVEDVRTGLKIHSRGWRSVYCTPDPPAFLGCAPSDVPVALIQQKRWATGLLQNLFNRQNPLFATLNGRLEFRESLAYMWLLVWGLRSILELFYAALPAYCIITNSYFLPKGLALCIPVVLFVIYDLYTLSEYLRAGASAQSWWDAQKMGRIISATAWLFGVFGMITKLLGLSEPAFDVTQKGQAASTANGGFIFNESPIFVPATTLTLVHLSALVTTLLGLQLSSHGGPGSGIGEMVCSLLVVLCFWPFVEGLFKKGRYGIPTSTICKSAALALLFVHFCGWTKEA